MSTPYPQELDGLAALVTGGASGIGLATCGRLTDEGFTVAALDMKPDGAAGEDCGETGGFSVGDCASAAAANRHADTTPSVPMTLGSPYRRTPRSRFDDFDITQPRIFCNLVTAEHNSSLRCANWKW